MSSWLLALPTLSQVPYELLFCIEAKVYTEHTLEPILNYMLYIFNYNQNRKIENF